MIFCWCVFDGGREERRNFVTFINVQANYIFSLYHRNRYSALHATLCGTAIDTLNYFPQQIFI